MRRNYGTAAGCHVTDSEFNSLISGGSQTRSAVVVQWYSCSLPAADKAEELPIETDPHRGLADRQGHKLRVIDLDRRPRPGRDRILISEHIRCNDKGFQIKRHLELQSRGGQLSGGPFVVKTRVAT